MPQSPNGDPARSETGVDMNMATSICAQYKCVDGWHVFYSYDIPGLYVASLDREAAYADLGPSIEMLFKLDDGIDCKVKPALTYPEFIAALP